MLFNIALKVHTFASHLKIFRIGDRGCTKGFRMAKLSFRKTGYMERGFAREGHRWKVLALLGIHFCMLYFLLYHFNEIGIKIFFFQMSVTKKLKKM